MTIGKQQQIAALQKRVISTSDPFYSFGLLVLFNHTNCTLHTFWRMICEVCVSYVGFLRIPIEIIHSVYACAQSKWLLRYQRPKVSLQILRSLHPCQIACSSTAYKIIHNYGKMIHTEKEKKQAILVSCPVITIEVNHIHRVANLFLLVNCCATSNHNLHSTALPVPIHGKSIGHVCEVLWF